MEEKENRGMSAAKIAPEEYWLAGIRKLPGRKKYLLRQQFKNPENVYYIEETELSKIQFLTEAERNTILQAKKRHGDMPENMKR